MLGVSPLEEANAIVPIATEISVVTVITPGRLPRRFIENMDERALNKLASNGLSLAWIQGSDVLVLFFSFFIIVWCVTQLSYFQLN